MARRAGRRRVRCPSRLRPIHGAAPGRIEAGIAAGERMSLTADPRPLRLPSGEWVGAWAVTLAQAAAHALAADRSALLVVPDYRDQEQLEAALGACVDARRVLRTDARQSGGDRFRAFLDATRDEARVIVGNRSTIYAPATRLGLIAMWDDGDALLNEPLAPGVHPRDAALVRQEQSGAALLLAAHTRSVEVERLVEIGWVHDVATARHREAARSSPRSSRRRPSPAPPASPPRPGGRRRRRCARGRCWCRSRGRATHRRSRAIDAVSPPAASRCGGALAIPRGGGEPRCVLCGTSAGAWRCPVCDGTKLRAVTVGASRTAEELGRAFPRSRVILSDGERPVLRVGAEPALVVATRGAEPIAAGGYRAVLLLDGERMLLRESLRVAEDCLRWWSNAAALATPGAPVFLVGVGGALATTFATWKQPEWARAELATRRALRFPPAVRVASVTASHAAVARAADAVRDVDGVDILGPAPVDDDLERAIVRFDYAAGARVARELRAEMIRVATERRRPVAGRAPRRPPVLRVRFDDPDVP